MADKDKTPEPPAAGPPPTGDKAVRAKAKGHSLIENVAGTADLEAEDHSTIRGIGGAAPPKDPEMPSADAKLQSSTSVRVAVIAGICAILVGLTALYGRSLYDAKPDPDAGGTQGDEPAPP